MHEAFEAWFKQQEFYLRLVFIHGESLMFKDKGNYRLLVVQIAFEAYLEGRLCTKPTLIEITT